MKIIPITWAQIWCDFLIFVKIGMEMFSLYENDFYDYAKF